MTTVHLIIEREVLTGRDATEALAGLPEPHRLIGPAEWLANGDHRTVAQLIAAGHKFDIEEEPAHEYAL